MRWGKGKGRKIAAGRRTLDGGMDNNLAAAKRRCLAKRRGSGMKRWGNGVGGFCPLREKGLCPKVMMWGLRGEGTG